MALVIPLQRRMNLHAANTKGYPLIRAWHRKEHRRGRRVLCPRYLLKCGCCNEKVEILYDSESLEINGVQGSLENWREILLPLLDLTRIPKKRKRKRK